MARYDCFLKQAFHRITFILVVIFGVDSAVQTCQAELLLSTGGTDTLRVWSRDNVTSGFRFTTDSRLRVTDLGILDVDAQNTSGSNGLFEDHLVGLWDDSGALVVETTVSAGTVDPLINGFRFSKLATAVEIGPGTYWLGAYYQTQNSNVFSADLWRILPANEAAAAAPSWATIEAMGQAGGYGNPGTGSVITGGRAYVGPNLMATTVPEPTTMTSFALMAGLFTIRRNRRSAG